MLTAHNAVRARVKVPPLTWSDLLSARAEEWADTLLARNQSVRRPDAAYGENLFEIDGAAATPTRVVDTWAAESRNYDYPSARCCGTCGHYTQIVWRNSRNVGSA